MTERHGTSSTRVIAPTAARIAVIVRNNLGERVPLHHHPMT
ncbi:MAG TPA: hypothetical protein VE523_11850 [Solirubrobacterales bacterium]|nr:hypothetical protein [Solirubrobacterales bacterium]